MKHYGLDGGTVESLCSERESSEQVGGYKTNEMQTANSNNFQNFPGLLQSGTVGTGGSASESTKQSCEGVKPKIKQTRLSWTKKVE